MFLLHAPSGLLARSKVAVQQLPRYSGSLNRNFSQYKMSESIKRRFTEHDLARYETEQLILVDKDDKEIGARNIVECHLTEFTQQTGGVHRAFSVLLFDPDFRLLLQRRAKTKPIFPLYWANSCCSHPLKTVPGEDQCDSDIGVKRAAQRRVRQELRLEVPAEDFKPQGRLLYKAYYDEVFSESEMDHVLAAMLTSKMDRVPFNPHEMCDIKWVALEELDDTWPSSKPRENQSHLGSS